MLNLLRRKLAQAGIPLSIAKMMRFAYRYSRGDAPLPRQHLAPRSLFVRTVLADMDPIQRQLVKTLGLGRYRSP